MQTSSHDGGPKTNSLSQNTVDSKGRKRKPHFFNAEIVQDLLRGEQGSNGGGDGGTSSIGKQPQSLESIGKLQPD